MRKSLWNACNNSISTRYALHQCRYGYQRSWYEDKGGQCSSNIRPSCSSSVYVSASQERPSKKAALIPQEGPVGSPRQLGKGQLRAWSLLPAVGHHTPLPLSQPQPVPSLPGEKEELGVPSPTLHQRPRVGLEEGKIQAETEAWFGVLPPESQC